MTLFRRTVRTVAVVAAALVVATTAACGDDDDAATTTTAPPSGDTADLEITDVRARAAEDLTGSDRSAVYLVIEGGSEDDALVAASVPGDIAGTTEVHETVMDEEPADGDMGSGDMGSGDGGAMMTMREVDSVEVPAGGTVVLEPGGYHVMLLDLAAPLIPGETFEVTLTFEIAGERTVTAEVRGT